MSNFLVSAVFSELGNGAFQKGPAFFCFVEVQRRSFGELLFEGGRGSAFREGGRGGGGDRGRFRKNDLRITLIRCHIVFITTVTGINQEIETAVGILHLDRKR